MRHQISLIPAGSWYWPFLIIFLSLLVIGFIIYTISRRGKETDDSPLSDEEKMAEIYCPELLSEAIQLRAEVKKLKSISDRRDTGT